MKCKTCKHWNGISLGIGTCSGLVPQFKIIPLPSVIDKKGNLQKRSKLLKVRSGVTGVNNPMTTADFYCKNWCLKQLIGRQNE
jgi:hypothetical protein